MGPSRRGLWLAALVAVVAACEPTDASDLDGTDGKADDVDELEEPFDPAIAARIGDLFEQIVNSRHPPGDKNVKRAVFLKPHACARARFEIPSNLPQSHRHGLFATPGTRDAFIRVSSDTIPTTSDFQNNTIGFAVKVLGVPGKKILPGEENFTTQDFVTQNHNVFFVDTAQDFLDFTEAIFDGTLKQYLAEHPTTDAILTAMKKRVENVLGQRYFSTTPYRFGDSDHAKYSVRPCKALPAEPLPSPLQTNYLRTRMERDIAAVGACFELQVQLRTGDMPLDRATVEWDEKVSPPVTVAVITVPPQDIKAIDADCEKMSFTAWHALPAHRPVGSVNEARRIIYKRLADLRRKRNSVPIAEPASPSPLSPAPQGEPQ